MPTEPDSVTDAFARTRRSLLTRLKDWDDTASWQQFFDDYGKLIYRFAIKAGLNEAESQDVVQETLIAIAKQMPSFRYDSAKGSFRRWLFTQARWRIGDVFRNRQRPDSPRYTTADDSTRTAEMELVPDSSEERLEAAWHAEWRQNQLTRALERVKGRVGVRQYQMFHLFAVEGWSMSDIVRTLKVNRAQVYMAKMRVGKLLKREILALES